MFFLPPSPLPYPPLLPLQTCHRRPPKFCVTASSTPTPPPAPPSPTPASPSCPTCDGATTIPCPDCDAFGFIEVNAETDYRTCATCIAKGKIPCPQYEVCEQGVTTAVMGASGTDVVDDICNELANCGSAGKSVNIVRSAERDGQIFDAEGRIWVVDVGDSVQTAVEVLKEAEHRFEGVAICTRSRLSNGCVEETSTLLRGVLVWGGDPWSSILPLGGKDMGDLMGLPRQSYDGQTVVGMVVWGGKGLVRCDRRKTLAECCAPGEGGLDVRGIIAEMLAKACVVPKFGA